MKSSIVWFGMLLLLAASSEAQMWTDGYDGSLGTLPSGQGFTHVLSDPLPDDLLSEGNYTVVVGTLIQGDTGGPNTDPANTQWYESVPVAFDFDRDEIVLDLRLKIVSSTMLPPGGGFARAGFGVALIDAGRRSATLYVGETGAFIWGNNAVSGSSALSALDTTDGFHDYRLQIDRSGASLEIDGGPSVTLAYDELDVANPPPNVLRFGDLSQLESSSSEIESLLLSGFHPHVTEVRQYVYNGFTGGATSDSLKVNPIDCPVPFRPLGGGATVVGGEGKLGLSGGYISTNIFTEHLNWTGEGRELIDTPDDWQLHVTVICGELSGQLSAGISPGLAGTNEVQTASLDCDDDDLISLKVHLGGNSYPLGLRALGPVSESVGQIEARNFDTPPAGSWTGNVDSECRNEEGLRRLTQVIPIAGPDSTSPKAHTALCPSETFPISGGARILGADTQTVLRGSYAQELIDPDYPIGWKAEAEEIVPTTDPWSLEVSVVCAPLAEPMVSMTGLVGRWKAELNAADALGINDGTFQNGATTAPGALSEAFSLDAASDQWVEVPGADFYPEASFSVELWIETTALQPGTNTEIINLYDSGGLNPGGSNTSAWGLRLSLEGYPLGFFRDKFGPGSTPVGPAAGAVSLADGLPHHLVLVRDSDLQTAFLYVDGVQAHEKTISITNDGPLEPGGAPDPVAIGIWRVGGASTLTAAFDGLIDDVKFYDRALSEEEIGNAAGCGLPLVPRTINLDAERFGGPPGPLHDHKFCTWLEAGSYTLTLVEPSLDADARFTAWRPDSSTDWGTAYRVDADIDGFSTGGLPLGSAPTPQQAFDDTLVKEEMLTLTVDQKVWFSLTDARANDNDGGVSLRIEYVPEPSGAVLLLTGIVAFSVLSRSRRARPGAFRDVEVRVGSLEKPLRANARQARAAGSLASASSMRAWRRGQA